MRQNLRQASQPDFVGAERYALARLEHDLPAALVYHSLTHTRDDVVPAVERLAGRAGVVGEALLLLRTAALFHDIGFIEQRAEHEAAGARIAAAVLPSLGFQPGQIATVLGMIMATRLPQSPHTLLEQLLADADLDVLGRDDFLVRNELLRAEFRAYGTVMSDAAWYSGQLSFLSQHRYWTHAAAELRGSGKRANVASLERALKRSLACS